MLSTLLHTVGQSYSYSYNSPTTASGPSPMLFFVIIAVIAIIVASMWRIFTKAGKPGWPAVVPIYSTVVLLQVVKRPVWWVLLFFIPFVNIIVGIIVYYDLVKAFGQGVGYLLLLLFLPIIGFPMLAFGSSKYDQPAPQSGVSA